MSAVVVDLATRRPTEFKRATTDASDCAITELRRARIRIAQLEASLTQAMRDSLTNFNRAREAEKRLEDLAREHKRKR